MSRQSAFNIPLSVGSGELSAPVLATAGLMSASSTTTTSASLTVVPPMWCVTVPPAAALGSGVRAASLGKMHICTGIFVCLSAVVSAQINPIQFTLWNGPSGGTALWVSHAIAAVNVARPLSISGLMLPASADAALTLDATGTLLATSVISLSFFGYTVDVG